MKPVLSIPIDSPSLGATGHEISRLAKPYVYPFKGCALVGWLLRWVGWRRHFDGFPSLHAIAVVYPDTSNWDAPMMFLAKWACGVPVRLIKLDYRLREISVCDFVNLSSDGAQDMARIAQVNAGLSAQ